MNNWQFYITIWVSVGAIIFSGVLAVLISHHLNKKYELRRIKFTTLSDLLAYRSAVTDNKQPEHIPKFFAVLNRVSVVFNDDENIVKLLNRLLNETGNDAEIIKLLVVAMSENIGLKHLSENDDLILSPFAPRKKD